MGQPGQYAPQYGQPLPPQQAYNPGMSLYPSRGLILMNLQAIPVKDSNNSLIDDSYVESSSFNIVVTSDVIT